MNTETARVEAFSDGVFAIAITLLILEIKIPKPSDGALGNQLGVPNSNVTPREQNLPIFSPSSYIGIGQTRSLPIYRRENTFQELDNLTITRGHHTLKMGIDFRRRQLTIYQTNLGNGRFNFSPAFLFP